MNLILCGLWWSSVMIWASQFQEETATTRRLHLLTILISHCKILYNFVTITILLHKLDAKGTSISIELGWGGGGGCWRRQCANTWGFTSVPRLLARVVAPNLTCSDQWRHHSCCTVSNSRALHMVQTRRPGAACWWHLTAAGWGHRKCVHICHLTGCEWNRKWTEFVASGLKVHACFLRDDALWNGRGVSNKQEK